MKITLFNEYQGRMMALMMALATIVFFGLGGAALITWAQERELIEVITVKSNVLTQIAAGLIGGSLIGFIAKFIVSHSGMKGLTDRYAQLIGQLHTTRADRIMIALCAGIGEEIFFRGAIQYWAGIPLTALIFVAIHGYLDPRDRKLFLYGLFMTAVMIGFGVVAERYGLWAPMAAHMMIDIVLLEYLQLASKNAPQNGETNLPRNPEL